MGRLLKRVLIVINIVFAIAKGNCQSILPAPGQPIQDQIFLSIGLDPEIVATIGYTHMLGDPGEKLEYHIGASLKIAPLDLSNSAWRANLIGAVDWKISDKWGSRFITELYNAHDNNRAGIMNGIGFELRATPVHYGKKWIKGFDVGWQYTAFTHIKHSAETKDTFEDRYPDGIIGIEGPRDGWYRGTASRFRLGFVGATSVGAHLRLQLGFGGLINFQKQGIFLGFSHAQVPFYLVSTLSYHW